jgi:signal transduction histidine kinase/FixJ family two-component response regulator
MEPSIQKSGNGASRQDPCGPAGAAGTATRTRGFLLAAFACHAAGAAWLFLAGPDRSGPLLLPTACFFLSLAAFAVLWSRFAVAYLGLSRRPDRILLGCGLALLAFHLAALAAAPSRGAFLRFNARGVCRIGPMGNLSLWGLAAFVSLIWFFAFAKARASRDAVHRRSMIVLVSCLAVAGSAALQAVRPSEPFAALGCLAALCFFHVAARQEKRSEKHEEKLRRALAHARAAEESRNMFFSIASHDIRAPLNAILGYAELLQHGIESPAGREEALASIRASGTTLLQLVNDVLDLSKMDAGKMTLRPEPVLLSRLTDEVFASFRLAADGKGTALANRTAEVPPVLLDAHRFRQILFNLVGNAVKFTDGGTVAVSASRTGTDLEVTVADTGCGIPPDMLEHVLDPFVQVRDASHSADRAGGTGLGLAICRGLVKAMGGTLAVESEPGKGSTFRIRLKDVASAAEEPAAVAGPERAAAPGKLPERVLVVDDSPVNRKVLAAFLEKAGVASIDQAGDGGEALAKLDAAAKEGRPHDFVFSDFWMPETNGPEFAEKLRGDARFRGLPVFAVTADTDARHDARAGLFSGILVKPLSYGKLLKALAAAPATSGGTACDHADHRSHPTRPGET